MEDHADNVAIMGQARLLAQGDLRELRRRTGLRLRIEVFGSGLDDLLRAIRELSGVEAEATDGGLTVLCGDDQKLAVLHRVADAGERVADFEMAPPTLADIYTHFGLAGDGPDQKGSRP